jgi:uroporphyrinogen decarboxylase
MDICGDWVRLVRYYQKVCQYDSVGACIANDDWGFKTHTMFSPKDLRRYIFPWYKKIVEVVHAAGKPIFLHSCGYFEQIIEDIIEDMKFDGRHSNEDNIVPVEEAYERYHNRIAILGGIDVDFICRSSPEDITYGRSEYWSALLHVEVMRLVRATAFLIMCPIVGILQ